MEPYAVDVGADSCAGDADVVILGAEGVEDGGDAGAGAGDAEGSGVGGLVEVEVDKGWVVGTLGGLLEETWLW